MKQNGKSRVKNKFPDISEKASLPGQSTSLHREKADNIFVTSGNSVKGDARPIGFLNKNVHSDKKGLVGLKSKCLRLRGG